MSIDDAAQLYGLNDLRPALSDYQRRAASSPTTPRTIVGSRGQSDSLPFDLLNIWVHVRIQNKAYYSPHQVLPAQTVNAVPPSDDWPHGSLDTILFNMDAGKHWPQSGLQGIWFHSPVVYTSH